MSRIFAYWEGDARHWFYDLCWKTIIRWNPGATLLLRRDVEAVIGPLPPELEAAYVTHRVDWIRKEFIRRVGGLWLDLDFICWSDLSPLAEIGQSLDYLGWQEWHGTGWMDNFFAAHRIPRFCNVRRTMPSGNSGNTAATSPGWLSVQWPSITPSRARILGAAGCRFPRTLWARSAYWIPRGSARTAATPTRRWPLFSPMVS